MSRTEGSRRRRSGWKGERLHSWGSSHTQPLHAVGAFVCLCPIPLISDLTVALFGLFWFCEPSQPGESEPPEEESDSAFDKS